MIKQMYSVFDFYWLGDSVSAYQLGFQDPATTAMKGIFLFNFHLLFVIIGIVLLVAWLMFFILFNFY
jgi:heme/copper-type cytochrome/quinol oxidase subunit 2